MEPETLILELGLNKNQATVYLTLLQMGSGYIQDIAKKAAIKRTTTYSILDNLVHQKLAYMVQKGAHREYIAENPAKIPKLLKDKERELREQQRSIMDILPELASLYNAHATKPKIRTYEGIEGIKQLFEETLNLPSGTETLAYSSYQVDNKYLKEYLDGYIERRAKKGISQRAIVEFSSESIELQKRDKAELRKTRMVDKEKFPFSNQINIFGNKIMIASYKDLMGVIIESSEVANTQRAIFELAWLGADRAENKL